MTSRHPRPSGEVASRPRDPRRFRRALAVALGAGVLAASSLACTGSNGGPDVPDVNDPEAPPATAANGAPEFPLPADPGAQIRAAGLRELPEDAEVTRAHAHVDVAINSYVVDVPAGIGITPGGSSPLNTPADDGIVRIEIETSAAEDELPTYTLGQLFTQWGVRLDKSCVATYCTDDTHQLLGFVNGQLVGDPASIAFADGDQIVVWFGQRGTNPSIPVSYEFPPSSTR